MTYKTTGWIIGGVLIACTAALSTIIIATSQNFLAVILIIGAGFFIPAIVKYLWAQERKNKLKKYTIVNENDDDYVTVGSDREDKYNYRLLKQEIIDEEDYYDDKLIATAIAKEKKEQKEEFHRQVKQDCWGLNARCSSCNYTWKIRKEKSVPAYCPKCHKHKVTVKWADNN